jgi:hypothetical protein
VLIFCSSSSSSHSHSHSHFSFRPSRKGQREGRKKQKERIKRKSDDFWTKPPFSEKVNWIRMITNCHTLISNQQNGKDQLLNFPNSMGASEYCILFLKRFGEELGVFSLAKVWPRINAKLCFCCADPITSRTQKFGRGNFFENL